MPRLAILAVVCALACATPRQGPPSTSPSPGPTAPGPAAAPEPEPAGVERYSLETAEAFVRVTFPSPDTVRVQLSPAPPGADAPSFAVEPEALAHPARFTVEEGPDAVTLRAAGAGLRIGRHPLALALLDADGATALEDAAPVLWGRPGFTLAFALPPGERLFGLGDKVKGQDRRGQWFELWNTDAYGWKGDTDPLYKSIPFLVGLREGRAHGLFVDTPARALVDSEGGKKLTWKVARGEGVDLYLFAGPAPRRVVSAFTALTGRTPLPPRWALGYHQSRYSYMSEAETREVAARLRAERIPTDAIWLDIDYQVKNAPFSVDRARFPRFEAMVSDLRAEGIRTVVITDPHIAARQGEEPYESGLAGDHFLRDPAGKLLVAEVWPGPSVFPEFTLARTRAWWGGLYRQFVDWGVAGFWNDMNEPAVFDRKDKTLPPETPHRLEGGGVADHVTIHDAYGLLNARATYEGLRALRPDERPFVLTRAAYAGAQRWAASWTGDDTASREHLALTVPTLTNLGASGYAFVGADVGGFVGCPDAPLLTAWMEAGALQPLFRNHSAKDTCRREPWVHGPEHLRVRRLAVERRYRLLPYLYTAFEETARTGLPVMRPLWLEYPGDPASVTNDRAWLLGGDLLVAPRLDAGSGPVRVTLPPGGWWDVRTGARVEGGAPTPLAPGEGESLVVLARAGAVVPQGPVVQRADVAPQGPLTVDVWPGPRCEGALYLDDGETFAYARGALRRIRYACAPTDRALAVTARSEGGYATWWSATEVRLHGVPARPATVTAGGAPARGWAWDPASSTVTVTLPGAAAEFSVTAAW